MLVQLSDVLRAAYERESHDVGVFDHELECLKIVIGEARKPKIRFRNVNPFFGRQLLSLRARVIDFNFDLSVFHRSNHAADVAIVEPNGLASPNTVEELRWYNANSRE